MTSAMAQNLIVLAAGFSGLLAGASADRYLVQVTAWRRMDVMTWAEHSRHADLGNGRFWYPLLAFAATGFSVAAAWGIHDGALNANAIRAPAYLAAVASLVGLLFTFLAAPNLLRLRRPQERETTTRSFRLFHRWGVMRAAFQIAAFPLNLWALWTLSAPR